MFVSQKAESYLSIGSQFKKKCVFVPSKINCQNSETQAWELQKQKSEIQAQDWKNIKGLLQWPLGDF